METRKTYSVHFLDAKDASLNHKIITANRIEDVCQFMKLLGHEITKIVLLKEEEVAQ